MAQARQYSVDSTLVSVGSTSATPALYIAPTSTNDLNISRIKVSVEATSTQSASPSTNNSIFFSLNKVTGSKGGGGAVTPTPLGASALAANTVWSSAQSAAITGLTQGVEYWGQTLALSAGAWAEDSYENTGLEINIPASGQFCFYFIAASSAGSNLAVRIIPVFSE